MIQETTGIDNIEDALNGLLKLLTDGEPVLNERAPGGRPQNQPFTTFMVYWLDGHAFVFRAFDATGDGLKETIADDAYVTARVICWGKDSMRRCSALRMALNSDMQPVQAFRQDIGICDIDDVQSIPEPNVDASVRERAYFNFKFYARVACKFDIDWFNKVSLALSVPDMHYATTDAVKKE